MLALQALNRFLATTTTEKIYFIHTLIAKYLFQTAIGRFLFNESTFMLGENAWTSLKKKISQIRSIVRPLVRHENYVTSIHFYKYPENRRIGHFFIFFS